ncbi:MAG: hypothetical protein AVDCRST_MAG19-4331 [uncultured Thermomicrobiales bacterium]|uniref:Uncharacterized protein n=1 Tax=uncultured Thermomicrobiales bacterium TaxID=1645740 RepID=A0A6J4VNN7_9BACT|nr:MAG: hypothetical protein AVDCRST_MAG19-4331 [uncultured Thermomicrobiales bacterium]
MLRLPRSTDTATVVTTGTERRTRARCQCVTDPAAGRPERGRPATRTPRPRTSGGDPRCRVRPRPDAPERARRRDRRRGRASPRRSQRAPPLRQQRRREAVHRREGGVLLLDRRLPIVQGDLGHGDRAAFEDPLQRRDAHAALDHGRGAGVPKEVAAQREADIGAGALDEAPHPLASQLERLASPGPGHLVRLGVASRGPRLQRRPGRRREGGQALAGRPCRSRAPSRPGGRGRRPRRRRPPPAGGRCRVGGYRGPVALGQRRLASQVPGAEGRGCLLPRQHLEPPERGLRQRERDGAPDLALRDQPGAERPELPHPGRHRAAAPLGRPRRGASRGSASSHAWERRKKSGVGAHAAGDSPSARQKRRRLAKALRWLRIA